MPEVWSPVNAAKSLLQLIDDLKNERIVMFWTVLVVKRNIW